MRLPWEPLRAAPGDFQRCQLTDRPAPEVRRAGANDCARLMDSRPRKTADSDRPDAVPQPLELNARERSFDRQSSDIRIPFVV